MSGEICTCMWSRVDTATEDPPYIVARDEDCPLHGVRVQPDFFGDDGEVKDWNR